MAEKPCVPLMSTAWHISNLSDGIADRPSCHKLIKMVIKNL